MEDRYLLTPQIVVYAGVYMTGKKPLFSIPRNSTCSYRNDKFSDSLHPKNTRKRVQDYEEIDR